MCKNTKVHHWAVAEPPMTSYYFNSPCRPVYIPTYRAQAQRGCLAAEPVSCAASTPTCLTGSSYSLRLPLQPTAYIWYASKYFMWPTSEIPRYGTSLKYIKCMGRKAQRNYICNCSSFSSYKLSTYLKQTLYSVYFCTENGKYCKIT